MSNVTKKKPASAAASSSMDTAKALELLDQVVAALALPTPPSLTTKQRKAATRSRKGMERVIPTLANLSKEHGVSVPKQSTSQMTSQLALVSELEPVQQKLVGILTLVGNTLDDARSSSWTTGTTLYGMLRKVAYRDPQLGSQLAPVKEFFAYRTAAAQEAHPKQKSKKQALANEKAATAKAETAASPATPAPAPEPPSASSAPAASTNASAPAPASPSVVTPHVP